MDVRIKLTLGAMFTVCAIMAIFLFVVLDTNRNVEANTKTLNSIDTRLKAETTARKAAETEDKKK